MISSNGGGNESQELKFLNNLKEDLHVLQTSWQKKKLRPKKVVRPFVEIVDSIAEIARAESLERTRATCVDLKKHLETVARGSTNLNKRSWETASKLIDQLSDSLRQGTAPPGELEDSPAQSEKKPRSDESRKKDAPAKAGSPNADSAKADSPNADSAVVPDDEKTPNLEESKMPHMNPKDPEELLRQAQEALVSGKGENAREMALKAAELITQAEAEDRKKQEYVLKVDLENLVREEKEIEQAMTHTKEQIGEGDEKLNAITDRLAEAQDSVDKHEAACKKVQDEIDETEAHMATIRERQQQLAERLQEVQPAHDAADREFAKIKSEYGELPTEIEALRDSLMTLDHQMGQLRKKKDETEAKLEELAVKSAV